LRNITNCLWTASALRLETITCNRAGRCARKIRFSAASFWRALVDQTVT
jgi:hypothetical protein